MTERLHAVEGATTSAPCARCQAKHRYGDDGWYAGAGKDRHPFTPGPRAEQIVVESRTIEGNTSALFGALERCGACKALLEPEDGPWHRDWHARLDEVIAIAWRLANQHGDEAA